MKPVRLRRRQPSHPAGHDSETSVRHGAPGMPGNHDFSTSRAGVVPRDQRRPMWHFMGLWTTLVAGFSFGAFWLAFLVATLSQFAINDGNYYEAVNAAQNLLGGWRRWRRYHTCLLLAG